VVDVVDGAAGAALFVAAPPQAASDVRETAATTAARRNLGTDQLLTLEIFGRNADDWASDK
jgi:hypothetical protein